MIPALIGTCLHSRADIHRHPGLEPGPAFISAAAEQIYYIDPMPFFAKHWIQRVALAAAGVLISSLGPDQVPVDWRPVLFWFGVTLAIIAAIIWPLTSLIMSSHWRFPERHKYVVQELAAPLATVQEQALTYGQRDFAKRANARAQAEELISQIPYDHATVQTVRDFLQACGWATQTHNTADEMREARDDVARISPALFRYLHDGRAVNRRKVDLPDWCRGNEGKQTKPEPLPRPSDRHAPTDAGYAAPPRATRPQQVSFDQAFQESAKDKIPFVRIRDLAPGYELGLGEHDPDASNVAYGIERALRQAAVDGELKVWGRRYRRPAEPDEPMVPIPSLHFEDYGFAHGVLHHATDNREARTNTLQMATWGQKGKTGATYYDLQLSFEDTKAVLNKVAKGEAP